MRPLFCSLTLWILTAGPAGAQSFTLPRAARGDLAELARAMPALASQLLAKYTEPAREQSLDTRFRLQLLAGQYTEAIETVRSLREVLKSGHSPAAEVAHEEYEIFAAARREQAERHVPFEEAFGQAFREAFGKLSDRDAWVVARAFAYEPATGRSLTRAEDDLRESLAPLKKEGTVDLKTALALARAYLAYDFFKQTSSPAESLVREDDHGRYRIEDVLVKTGDGATLSAIVVRNRKVTTPAPTALTFTIYAFASRDISPPQSASRLKLAAALGYVGVVGFTRGKGASPDAVVPYEHDGRDVNALIDWIVKQPWSDGRVGMYGGSYNGFTQWAAAKNPHPALKTIVPYAANNPGDGLPMENNIFLLPNYPWVYYVTNNKYVDDAAYADPHFHSLNEKWYAGGKPYRQVDRVAGVANPWLQRWLRHPAYDGYWQGMLPYKDEFARINIPVLTITGYYDDGQQSALHFLKEHYRHNPRAEHYLLIGPYDHFGSQAARKDAVLRGYAIDPVAQVDTPEITFQWFDHVFRGGKRPALIKDRINYEVMGANEWRHAPSLEKTANAALTLYLTDAREGDRYRLSAQRQARPGSLHQEVDFADRKTSNNDYYPFPVVGKKPDLSNGFCFLSAPFEEPLCVSGTFSGEIKARINKRDMDVGVVLYEVLPDGRLLHLSYFVGRASYARDMSVRRLLTPGQVETIPFEKTRMVSRKLARGSRLLVTLNVNKNRFAQINYGTGKDVSDEDLSDAKVPLQVEWLNDSFVRIPVWKGE
jgi:putative CocE/NonD family hydrolase